MDRLRQEIEQAEQDAAEARLGFTAATAHQTLSSMVQLLPPEKDCFDAAPGMAAGK